MKTATNTADGTAGLGPCKGRRPDNLISGLPSDISLLPTKDGARTQAVARRWRPLWRSAHLNLGVDYHLCEDESKRCSIVSKILPNHLAPARRFYFNDTSRHECVHIYGEVKRHAEEPASQIDCWFCSEALDNLEEIDICFGISDKPPNKCLPLPPCVLRRCASTIVVAKIAFCSFAKLMAPWPCFPLLKQITLQYISISEDVFLRVLSGCHALESLYICNLYDVGCLRVSSPSLRSLGIATFSLVNEELVIEDTPCLERLLLSSPRHKCGVIRVIRAPRLEILGPLPCYITRIEMEKLDFQRMIPVRLSHSICTVKVFALQYSAFCLDLVLNVLMYFPCLEKLYATWDKNSATKMKSVRQYDPLDPIKCFESHLKILVLKNYEGIEQNVNFAKFFLSNAKALKAIKFLVQRNVDKIWVVEQYRLLEVEKRASRDAQFEFRSGSGYKCLNTHDLSIADPFSIRYGVYGGNIV